MTATRLAQLPWASTDRLELNIDTTPANPHAIDVDQEALTALADILEVRRLIINVQPHGSFIDILDSVALEPSAQPHETDLRLYASSEGIRRSVSFHKTLPTAPSAWATELDEAVKTRVLITQVIRQLTPKPVDLSGDVSHLATLFATNPHLLETAMILSCAARMLATKNPTSPLPPIEFAGINVSKAAKIAHKIVTAPPYFKPH